MNWYRDGKCIAPTSDDQRLCRAFNVDPEWAFACYWEKGRICTSPFAAAKCLDREDGDSNAEV